MASPAARSSPTAFHRPAPQKGDALAFSQRRFVSRQFFLILLV